MNRPVSVLFFAILPMVIICPRVEAQVDKYPSRPIRAISGFPPGSSVDVVGRFMTTKLTERLGQQVIIDNRPGASGNIGADLAARATPDGYTIFLMSSSHIMSAPVYKSLPFHPVKSFTAITPLGSGPLMMVSHPSFAPNSVKDLIDLAKSKPDTLTYSSSGNGGINHFATALFARAAGIKMLHVPHKGGSPAFIAVMAGQIHIMVATLPLSITQIRAGKVKPLGVTSLNRTPLFSSAPPIAETVPGYEVSTWWGVLAPPGLPAPILKRLNAEITAILNQPESAQRLAAEGAEPWPLSSAEYAKVLQSELDKWTRVAQEVGIRAD
jgi:tripartite-type tricarboxylate transporter receptor subunit TctC